MSLHLGLPGSLGLALLAALGPLLQDLRHLLIRGYQDAAMLAIPLANVADAVQSVHLSQ